MTIQFPEIIFHNLLHRDKQIAFVINEIPTNYKDLKLQIGGIQSKMHRTGSTVVGIITQNHSLTYAAIIAAWLTGKAYVPINAGYPADRIRGIIDEAGITDLFYAEETIETENLRTHFTQFQWHVLSGIAPALPFNTLPTAEKQAYILFTSGTTGKPKGVPISFGNLQSFLDSFHELGYSLSEKDRFLQMFELTFDLSVMSFLVPLTLGASFYTLPSGMIKTLGLYHVLESYEITFSLMVPSAINLLAPYLEDIDLPKLRYSQFCGEALKADLVKSWSRCIPNAQIDNVYGPTEATIYCTSKTIDRNQPEKDSLSGIIGIGKPMKNVGIAVFNNGIPIKTQGETGELCLAGPQLTVGYLNNPSQNEKSFFMYENQQYYRTGDLVTLNESGEIFYIGRFDDQVKIQGFRIELAEIELAAAEILPAHQNVAIGFQDTGENWMLALFIQNLTADPEIIRGEIATRIPDYMVPHLIIPIDSFPLNNNGKTDKKSLRQLAQNKL